MSNAAPPDPTAGPAPAPSRPGRPGWRSLVVLVIAVAGAAEGLSWWQQQRLGAQLRERVRPGDIVMYTTSDCPYCAAARRWLEGERVAWRECNVEQDDRCLRTYQAAGAPGVPLFQVRGRWHLGFDPRSLSESLAADTPR